MPMSLEAIMKLDGAGFTGPLSAIRSSLGSLMGLIGVGGGIAGALAGLKAGLDMAGNAMDLRARTGIAVGELTVLRQAFDDTGVGAEAGMQAITLLQRNLSGLAGSGASDAVKRLGLDMGSLGKMGTVDQLSAIGKAMSGVSDPAKQTALAMELFGRSGAAMKQFFADPAAIETVRKSFGSLPDILQRSGPALDNIGDALGRMKTKMTGLFVGFEAGLAPAIKAVTDWIDSIDFARAGEKFGTWISTIIEAFKSGQLGELIGRALSSGIVSVLKALPDIVIGIFQSIWEAIKGMFGFVTDMVTGGLDGANDKLGELWASLEAKVQANRVAVEKAAEPAKAAAGEGLDDVIKNESMSVSSDKLARMGGFIGMGGGPALDAARRTADATHRTAEGVERLHQALSGNHLLGSVWA